MKENEAPEKIYLFENPVSGTPNDRWVSKRNNDNDIEYICTDVFVEKACEYLSYHLDINKIDINYKFEFIEDFRNYIKGK